MGFWNICRKVVKKLTFVIVFFTVVFMVCSIQFLTLENRNSFIKAVSEKTYVKRVERYWRLVNYFANGELNQALDPVLSDFTAKNAYSLWRPSENDFKERRYDRILDQLVWLMEPQVKNKLISSKPKTVLLLDYFKKWNIFEKKLKCPGSFQNCKFLENRNQVVIKQKTAELIDAVVLTDKQHDSIQNLPSNVKKFYYFLESPWISSPRSGDQNSFLASYWRGSDIVTPYAKWTYYNSSINQKQQNKNYAEGKTKMAAIFISNCLSYNDRLAYAKELGKHIQVDIYGQCGQLKCSRDEEQTCFNKLRTEYKFYLAFENTNCRDYITEKFFNTALQNNVVPVVLGAHRDDYKAAAPYNSYIHVEDFASPKLLASYLRLLNENDSLYNEFFQWKGTGEFINTHFLCRVCAMLHYADYEKPAAIPTAGFPWTFTNDELCLRHHRWFWGQNSTNSESLWDVNVVVKDRLERRNHLSSLAKRRHKM